MNFLAAVLSERPFKRPSHLSYMTAKLAGGSLVMICSDPNVDYTFDYEDLQAADWELRAAPLAVNYWQFYAALNGDVSPNGEGGVAIDVGKAWRLLKSLVKESSSETTQAR